MSFYNLINGINPATFFVLPMLGEKHPDEYPRFRDCFMRDNDETEEFEIHVFTRVGGNNKNCGFGEGELMKHPNYLHNFDDEFDNTYATYVFSVPDEFKEDAKKVWAGTLKETSQIYKDRLYAVFPKLKDKFDQLFNNEQDQSIHGQQSLPQ